MDLNTLDCIILDEEEDEDGDAVVPLSKAQRPLHCRWGLWRTFLTNDMHLSSLGCKLHAVVRPHRCGLGIAVRGGEKWKATRPLSPGSKMAISAPLPSSASNILPMPVCIDSEDRVTQLLVRNNQLPESNLQANLNATLAWQAQEELQHRILKP